MKSLLLCLVTLLSVNTWAISNRAQGLFLKLIVEKVATEHEESLRIRKSDLRLLRPFAFNKDFYQLIMMNGSPYQETSSFSTLTVDPMRKVFSFRSQNNTSIQVQEFESGELRAQLNGVEGIININETLTSYTEDDAIDSIANVKLAITAIDQEEAPQLEYTNLSSLIPYPYFKEDNSAATKVKLLDNGTESLQARIDLIRSAKKNIEVEYFIFNTDMAGKIIARELVAAAQRGVVVRLLVDKSLTVFKLKAPFAKYFSEHGVELRYYNAAPLWNVSSIQFRNHRKLISVDDQLAVTGGRNIGDDYFDLSHEYNFYDRDVLVEGPLVQTMRESFDLFFEHKITQRPNLDVEITEEVEEFFRNTEAENVVRTRVQNIATPLLQAISQHTCHSASFSSDAPGGNFLTRISANYRDKFRFLRKTLYDKVVGIDELMISSPYLINNKDTRKMMDNLLKRNAKITAFTNSLAATDALYIAANLYSDARKWAEEGVRLYIHPGEWLGENPLLPLEVQQATWGTHSKTQIYKKDGGSEVMIGTYNLDNRSTFYNTEMAIFCKNSQGFTDEVESSMKGRMSQAYLIGRDGKARNSDGEIKSVFGVNKKSLLLMRIITIPSRLFRFLL